MKNNFITLLLLFIFHLGMASSMSPMLGGLKVWEYYKYENGSYRNYALVINPQDTDIEVTILIDRGWYHNEYKYAQMNKPSDTIQLPSLPHEVTVVGRKPKVTPEDDLREGKPIIMTGDTLLFGMKLKRGEIRVIPDFFEKYRSRKIGLVSVYTNNNYAGSYTLVSFQIPKDLPHSKIFSSFQINTGEILPVYLMMNETLMKRKHRYEIQFYSTTYYYDTLQISESKIKGESKYFGLNCIDGTLSDISISDTSLLYYYGKRADVKDLHGSIKMKPAKAIVSASILISNEKRPSFCMIDIFYSSSRVGQVRGIPVPVNIKL